MKNIMKILLLFAAIVLISIKVYAFKNKPAKEIWETTPNGPYSVVITNEEIACEHPKRKRESIRWDQVIEIRLVTTDEGPLLPDMWFLFIGKSGGCSIPSEAKGFDPLWDEFKTRYEGFNFKAIIEAGTENKQVTLWEQRSNK